MANDKITDEEMKDSTKPFYPAQQTYNVLVDILAELVKLNSK